jgi:putative phage-type endonuclease
MKNVAYLIHDLIQGSQEWKEFRQGKIGSSDVPAIMDISPFETKLMAWERMVLGKERPVTKAMTRGTHMEKEALEWANNMLDDEYKPVVMQCVIFPDLIASLDGWNGESVLEIKCCGQEAHLSAIAGQVPEYYMPQLQHQMFVSYTQSMKYVSYDGNRGVILDVKRDENFIHKMHLEIKAFTDSILSFKPPEPCSRDRIEISEISALKNARQYLDLVEQIDVMQIRADNLKKELIAAANHNRAKIGPVNLTKVIRRGTIDYDAIPELKYVDMEQYRKSPIESWRITGI